MTVYLSAAYVSIKKVGVSFYRGLLQFYITDSFSFNNNVNTSKVHKAHLVFHRPFYFEHIYVRRKFYVLSSDVKSFAVFYYYIRFANNTDIHFYVYDNRRKLKQLFHHFQSNLTNISDLCLFLKRTEVCRKQTTKIYLKIRMLRYLCKTP